MNIIKCEHGHFYDADKYTSCPHCDTLTPCGHGHMYDAHKYPTCPYCDTLPLTGYGLRFDVDEYTSCPNSDTIPSIDNRPTEFPGTITYKSTIPAENTYYLSYNSTEFNTGRECARDVLGEFKSTKDMDSPYIFVSYAHKDAEKVKPFFDVLENNRFNYWYDEGLISGKDFYRQISRNIKSAVQFILFLSNASQESENVKDEAHIAYKYGKNILVVYIEDIQSLDEGLELQIDRKQNLRLYKYALEEAQKRFYDELSKDALRRACVDCMEGSLPELRANITDHYKDIRLIAKGGMGEIYKATNIRTNADVIIKKVSFNGGLNGVFFKKSFENEKRALMLCRCPFIPQLIDMYEEEDCGYIVETYIHGDALNAKYTYTEKTVVDFAIKILHILKYLYYFGMVHCDIKPKNIIVNEFGDVYLLDFGSCQFVHEGREKSVAATFGFAAPETFNSNEAIDFRTDIFSLGKTMLALLVGDKLTSKNAFQAQTVFPGRAIDSTGVTEALDRTEVRMQHMTESLSYYNASTNTELDRIISRMVSQRKENRYFSIDELISDLEALRL